jgi:hypothetical protein
MFRLSRRGLSRLGVGVADRSFSGDLFSSMKSFVARGVPGLAVFSGDLGVPKDGEPPSSNKLKSLTFPVCSDCMRL